MLETFSTETFEVTQDITDIQKITGEKGSWMRDKVGFGLRLSEVVLVVT